jgi:ferredoxin
VADWQFSQLCLRCGNCGRACPAGIIRPDREPATIAAWLAPVILIEEDYCREDCSDCMQVCPSGAIEPGDLETKRRRPIGLARVDMDRCLLALDRECRTMCLEACPYEAIRLHEWTWEDDRRYPIIEAAKCPGCGACLLACTPMDAITILPPGATSPTLANRIARR